MKFLLFLIFKYICVFVHMSGGAFEDHKREPHTWQIKLQSVWAMKWVLERELRSSA